MRLNVTATLARAGLLTAVLDGLFSSVLVSAFYGSTATRLWQGVASVPFGDKALQDPQWALVGLAMHLCVAFLWSAVFLAAAMSSAAVRRAISTKGGVLTAAAVYGPIVWCMMSLVLIPSLTHRPPTINNRWWVQFFGHMVFVALPIVLVVSRGLATRERAGYSMA